jgi:uncharacterized protein (TIGR02466 family)
MVSKDENWIEKSDVLSIFPTFVWTIQSTPEFHHNVKTKVINALIRMNPDLADIPTGGSWQSNHKLYRNEEFVDLISCIYSTAKTVLRFLKVGYDVIEITGCWATINSPETSHTIHSHPNNFLSGVYYIQTQPGADTINFHDPRPQTGIIRPPVTELTAQNTDQVVVKVNNGTLLMFPAFLAHSVTKNESKQPRISISFNLMFSRFAENLSKPLWGPGPE